MEWQRQHLYEVSSLSWGGGVNTTGTPTYELELRRPAVTTVRHERSGKIQKDRQMCK